jgi:hypothetical protein
VKLLHKYLYLPAPDRWLLAIAALLLSVIRLGLWLLPFQTLLRLLAAMIRRAAVLPQPDSTTIDRVAWAVEGVSRYVPMATCLTQALATQVLLGRLGHTTSLRIGVARNAAGQFEAHAWVECEGRIVIGGLEDLSRYTPLPPLEGT